MESYRNIWNNLFNYLKEHWKVRNFELIEEYHIVAYIDYKIEYYPSKQYIEKIVASIGKLEVALNIFSQTYNPNPKIYDFNIRLILLNETKSSKFIVNNYHNRAYKDPSNLINSLNISFHKIAAKIELEGGARIEACSLIKKSQLKGFITDKITNSTKGIIFTKEKGGKEGNILVSIETYNILEEYFNKKKIFKIDRQKYMKDIRETCYKLNINPEGSHGLRWNFAQNRMFEYATYGYSYEESLQEVSLEMKHNRANITEHYL